MPTLEYLIPKNQHSKVFHTFLCFAIQSGSLYNINNLFYNCKTYHRKRRIISNILNIVFKQISTMSKELIKQVTPWYSSAEWRHVFKLIFSPESNYTSRCEGLNYMKMWKVRTPYLSGGIEGTIEILEAILHDENPDIINLNNKRLTQTVYSMAIMRFLNLIADSTKYNTMFHAAQNLQIPSWIIDIRHAVAHSTELIGLELLREAAQYSLKWLYEMYWKIENQDIVDYIIYENAMGPEEINYKQYLDRFLLIYDNVVVYMSEYRFKRICDINIHQLKKDLVTDIDNFLMNPNTYVSERCYLKSLLFIIIKRINQVIKKFKENSTFIEIYIDSLLNCNHFLSGNILPDTNPYYKEYVKFWTPLLDHIHVAHGIPYLVRKLMDLSSYDKSEKGIVAYTWLEYILKGLAKCKSVQNITQTNYMNPPSIKRAIVEASAGSPEIASPVMFRPDLPIDLFFIGMDALKYALLNNAGVPNGKYWKILLKLMDKELSQDDVNSIDSLQNIVNQEISYTDVFMNSRETLMKPYTVDDLTKVCSENNQRKANQKQNIKEKVPINGIDDEINIKPGNTWSIVEDIDEWEICPLGVVPKRLENC